MNERITCSYSYTYRTDFLSFLLVLYFVTMFIPMAMAITDGIRTKLTIYKLEKWKIKKALV